MEVIRKLALAMLVIGLVLVVWGYVRFGMAHETPAVRLPYLVELAIPGSVLLVMGWVGLVGYNVWRYLAHRLAESRAT
jgi:hypothetical protein